MTVIPVESTTSEVWSVPDVGPVRHLKSQLSAAFALLWPVDAGGVACNDAVRHSDPVSDGVVRASVLGEELGEVGEQHSRARGLVVGEFVVELGPDVFTPAGIEAIGVLIIAVTAAKLFHPRTGSGCGRRPTRRPAVGHHRSRRLDAGDRLRRRFDGPGRGWHR